MKDLRRRVLVACFVAAAYAIPTPAAPPRPPPPPPQLAPGFTYIPMTGPLALAQARRGIDCLPMLEHWLGFTDWTLYIDDKVGDHILRSMMIRSDGRAMRGDLGVLLAPDALAELRHLDAYPCLDPANTARHFDVSFRWHGEDAIPIPFGSPMGRMLARLMQ